MRRRQPRTRRGSAYLLALGASMLVLIIGLAAIARARVNLHLGAHDADRIRARLGAPSSVDTAVYLMDRVDNWRETHGNDAWDTTRSVNGVELSYKLYDSDGDLRDDPTDPVRVYGRARSGMATRIYSVLVQPQPIYTAVNLLDNGGMEGGINGYASWQTATVAASADAPHAGAGCLAVTNRFSVAAGVRSADLSGLIESGQEYTLEVWVRTRTLAESVNVSLVVLDEAFVQHVHTVTQTADTAWTRINGSVTPTWTGSPLSAYFVVSTTTTTQDFDIDDAGVSVPVMTGELFAIVPGTWRPETE